MKKLHYIAAVAMAGFLALPILNTAEAASVAILPLVNNVIDREGLESIYYDRAIEAVKLDPSYEIAESPELDAAINKSTTQQVLLDRKACEDIANAAKIDIVIAMQVDTMTVEELFDKEDSVILGLKGRFVSYNALNGKFIDKKIVEENKVEGSTLARYDRSGEQFANSVTREIKRVLGIKKITFEKPRISSSGLKGNAR